ILAIVVGVLLGYGIISSNIGGVLQLAIGGLAIYWALNANKEKLFAWLPYMIYAEIYMRRSAPFVPYLFAQYILIIVFLILIFKQYPRIKFHSLAFIFLLLFAIIEVVDSARSTDAVYARTLIVNSILLALAAMWASSVV